MQTEWIISIAVVVVSVLVMAYINRKSLVEAIEMILTNPSVITNTENVVGAQPVVLQETFKVIHRQMDLIESLARNAGLIDTPVGRIIDVVEDFGEEVTNDTPYKPTPPDTPEG
jgi:hypothetical protein